METVTHPLLCLVFSCPIKNYNDKKQKTRLFYSYKIKHERKASHLFLLSSTGATSEPSEIDETF